MRRLLLYILSLFVWMQAQAQEKHTLNGVVADTEGVPVSNANVQILENNKPIAYTFTNEKGGYALSYNSSKTLVLLSVGHLSFEKTNLVIDSKETQKNITLLRKKTQLKEVVVKAPEISQRGDTVSYQLSSFAGKGDYTLRDAMKRLPGIEVTGSGGIKYLGKDISDFYIEGMDLLGGQYNVATNNIPADYVTSVQVLNNHKDAKMDKDVLSDDVAINIKLSKHAKFKPVGTYEAIGGLRSNGTLYQVSGAGMLFKSHMQLLGTLKVGNIREFAADENINHFLNDQFESYGVRLLGNLSSSSAPIKRERYIHSNDCSLSFNILNKLSENKSLRTNVGYARSQCDYAYNHKMFFGNSQNELMQDYQYQPASTLHKPALNIEYKENSDKRYITNRFSSLASFVKSELPTVENNSNSVFQHEKYHDLGFTNDLSIRWKTNKFRWSFSSLLNYTSTPNGTIRVSDGGADSFQQSADSRQFTNKETISAAYERRNSRVYFPLSFQYRNERINSALLTDGYSGLNLLKGNELEISFSPQYEYTHPQRKYNFKAGISLATTRVDFENEGTTPLRKQKWNFMINPSFYFLYNVTPRATVRLQGVFVNRIGDLADFITAPIQTSLNYQKYGSGILSENRSITLNAIYDLKFPIEMFFLNVGLGYTHQHNNLLPVQDVSQTLIKEYPMPSPNSIDNINACFNITKQVKAINTKFSLYGIYMHSKSLMMQNSMIYSYSWNSLNVVPSVSFKPVSFMELYYTYSFSKNITKIQKVSKSFLSQTHDINLILQPVTNLQFKAMADISTKEMYQDLTKTIAIFDAGVSYRHRALRFSIDMRNIFNQQYYSYTIFNTMNTYTYSYHMRGRELLFTVSLTK
ncbi:lantibiotic ABC transporter [Prevotella denticola]|uniref:lantibiotic ABC transporter n=1 Tax=Prevotella denticola TaxID=28129 RepID=UPI0028EBB9CC|nr:lantibiotic ABC transporter [Prevotella denticola]